MFSLDLSWEHIVGSVAVVATIFQFLSGILACKQYVQNKTTGEASALPFLFGVLSCGVWYAYGNVRDDATIIFVNIVGVLLMMCYVVVFYKYAYKKKELKRQILYCLLFSVFMYVYVSREDDILKQHNILGSVACTLTLLTIAAPLVKLYYVIKVKSTACLPFHMILMSFFVSGLWMEYGILHKDTFQILPNLIGGVVAMCQLSLFVIYPNTPPALSAGKTLMA